MSGSRTFDDIISREDFSLENYNAPSRQRGLIALEIPSNKNKKQVKKDLKKHQANPEDYTKEDPEVHGFTRVEELEKDNAIISEFVHINNTKSITVSDPTQNFGKKKIKLPPANNTDVYIDFSDNIIYVNTPNSQESSKIHNYLENNVFETELNRVKPSSETISNIIEEKKDTIYALEVNPDISQNLNLVDGEEEISIEDSEISGDKGFLNMKDDLIDSLRLEQSETSILKIKDLTSFDQEKGIKYELRKNGEFKAHFSVSQFSTNLYSDRKLFHLLRKKFRDIVMEN